MDIYSYHYFAQTYTHKYDGVVELSFKITKGSDLTKLKEKIIEEYDLKIHVSDLLVESLTLLNHTSTPF